MTITKTERKQIEAAVHEALREITRINTAAGHTVFNPAAKDALRGILDFVEDREPGWGLGPS